MQGFVVRLRPSIEGGRRPHSPHLHSSQCQEFCSDWSLTLRTLPYLFGSVQGREVSYYAEMGIDNDFVMFGPRECGL